MPGPEVVVMAKEPGVGSADCGSDGGDFVFSLKGENAEILVLRKFVKDVGSGSNGIAAEEQFESGLLRSGDKAKSQRLIAAEVAVDAGSQLRWRNFVADLECFGGFAIGVAGLHGQSIGFGNKRLLLELVFDPADGGFHGAVVEPVAHAEGKEVLAAVHGLGIEAEVLESGASESLQFDREDAELIERMIFEGIGAEVGLAEVGLP